MDLPSVAESLSLFPSPRATDGTKGGPNQRGSSGDMMLPSALPHLALFHTPTAQLAVNGGSQHPSKRRSGGHGPTLADEVEHELDLFPTPQVADGRRGAEAEVGGRHPSGARRSTGLITAVHEVDLLPTPVTAYSQRSPEEWRAGRPAGNGSRRERIGDLEVAAKDLPLLPSPAARDHRSGKSNLLERNARPLNEVAEMLLQPSGGIVDWGKYARGVLRWEQVTGRMVPCPLQPGRNGNVLAPAFVEWMMGLPEGWVTDLGLSRTAMLRILGNGVVWQQAVLGLTVLWPRVIAACPTP
jgi:DNA (cytosine-5)-methyltransferase 1